MTLDQYLDPNGGSKSNIEYFKVMFKESSCQEL